MSETRTPDALLSLLRSLVIVGSANLVSVVIGVMRLKLVAYLFGPAGVGLWGIFSNALNTLATGAGLGVSTSAVRAISASQKDRPEVESIMFVLSLSFVLQGLVMIGAVAFFRVELASILFDGGIADWTFIVVAVAAFFAMMSAAKMSILQGQQQIVLLSKGNVGGAVFGTLLGSVILLTVPSNSILLFILVQPICGFLVMAYCVKRGPIAQMRATSLMHAFRTWKELARLGIPLMLGVLIQMSTILVVRALITRNLGLVEAGFFAATWTITMHYTGFLFAAMGSDFYPRLSKHIDDHPVRNDLVNRQIQLGLVLCTPMLLGMITLAPQVIALFYTVEFVQISDVLRWQLAGNLLKLISWPLAFVLIASKRSGLFFLGEVLWNGSFLAVVWFGLPTLGIAVVGFAFVISFLIYLIYVWVLLKKIEDVPITRLSFWLSVAAFACTATVLYLSVQGVPYAILLGCMITALSAIIGVFFLARQIHTTPAIIKKSATLARLWQYFN